MRPVIELAALSLLVGTSVPNVGVAQTTNDLVGTWTNVSSANIQQDGSTTDVFGPRGRGIAMFANNGRFVIVNIDPDVPKFASNNRVQGTAEENKAAVHGAIGSFGTYTVDEAKKSFTVRFEGSTYPNNTGVEQTRPFTITGDELKIINPASTATGEQTELTYKRAK